MVVTCFWGKCILFSSLDLSASTSLHQFLAQCLWRWWSTVQTQFSIKTTSRRSSRASPTSAASDQPVTDVWTSSQPQHINIFHHHHHLFYQDISIQTEVVRAPVISQFSLHSHWLLHFIWMLVGCGEDFKIPLSEPLLMQNYTVHLISWRPTLNAVDGGECVWGGEEWCMFVFSIQLLIWLKV